MTTQGDIQTARKLNLAAHEQYDMFSCGFCASYAILRFYNIKVTQKEVRQSLGVDSFLPYFKRRQAVERYIRSKVNLNLEGTWPMDIYAAFRGYGFKTQSLPYRVDKFLIEASELIQNKYPVLLLTLDFGTDLHWSVVIGINKRGVWVADSCSVEPDSPKGHCLYSYKEFCDVFLGGMGVYPDARLDELMTGMDYLRAYSDGAVFTAKAIQNTFSIKSRGLSILPLKKMLFGENK